MTTILFAALFSPPVLAQSVTNGSDVAEGDWEDTAGILFGRSSEPECTGVLVAPRVVLTAGHCVLHGSRPSAVLLGTNDYRYGGEKIDVASIIEHPNSQSTYDAAILILEQDATVEPRVIAQDCVLDNDLVDGAPVTIVGYGAINRQGTQYVPQLQEAATTVDDHDCSDMSLGCTRSVSPNGELGAGGEDNETDSCFGDSGGPLYLNTDKADYLVGLTSRGYSNACGPGGIYVRADALLDWIEDETGVTLPTPDCGGGGGGGTDTDTDTGGGGGGGGGNQDTNATPEPLADDIVVVAGGTATVTIDPNDPDSGDSHTFTVVTEPEHGEVSVDGDGVVTFVAGTGYSGADAFAVVVSDALGASGEVEVGVEIRRRKNGSDSSKDEPLAVCSAVSGSASLGLVGLVALAALGRRRR